jgi:iron complex transport system substrate-binding protein
MYPLIVACVAMVAILAGCSPSNQAASPSQSASDSGVVEAPFPRTLVDDAGNAVTIGAEPKRIVALSPASVETLASLGAAARVVGIAECTCTPASLSTIPIVATYAGTSVEKIIALAPDVVFVAGAGFTPQEAIDALVAAGLTVVDIEPQGVAGVLRSIRLIGDVAGASVAAVRLVDGVRADLDRLAALVAARPHPKVFYEIDATGALYGLAPDDYAAELVRLAGGEPVTSGSNGVYEISLERLIVEAPTVILLGDAAYGTTVEAVAARPGWASIPAVVQGAIRPIDGDLVTTPGPRIADALRALIAAIHPEIALPR